MIALRLFVVGTAFLAVSPGSARSERESPFTLCVTQGPTVSRTSSDQLRVVARALYRQLDESQRLEFRGALEESVVRREARLNPLAEDLEDGHPDSRLERLFETAPQLFGTARALVAPRYCGADGFCVRVTRGACSTAERSPRGRELQRARFLAWPYAYANLVSEADANARGGVAARFRRRSDVALVLEIDEEMSADEREVLGLVERREVLMRLESAETSGEEARTSSETPRLTHADEILVVPTLETVATVVVRD